MAPFAEVVLWDITVEYEADMQEAVIAEDTHVTG
jgi:hypothetical protein